MKVCNICYEKKSIVEFYKNAAMRDGYQNRCIECTKVKTKERAARLNSTPEGRAAERARHREKYHRLEYKEKHRQSQEKRREAMKNYYDKYPEKKAARNKCSGMKCPDGFHIHHWSYQEEHRTDVVELRMSNHFMLHRHLIYDPERMMYRTLEGKLLDTKKAHMEYYHDIKKQYITSSNT